MSVRTGAHFKLQIAGEGTELLWTAGDGNQLHTAGEGTELWVAGDGTQLQAAGDGAQLRTAGEGSAAFNYELMRTTQLRLVSYKKYVYLYKSE